MGNEEPESPHPIRSLHEFLSDVEKELKKFRRMSILGAIAAAFILIVLGRFTLILFQFSPHIPRGAFLVDLIIIILALAFLFYSIYALLGQNAFLKRWGKRFKQLQTLEQKLLEEKAEKN